MSDLGPQETGVTNTSTVQFGPASREYYDTNKWALTTHSSTHEIVLDPDPADRRRLPGEPPCLRPFSSGRYLAPILTILHSIPLAREALLCRDYVAQDYGYDDEWWSGGVVRVPSVVELAKIDTSPYYDEIIYETQRLMAFLDKTHRSYGSVEGVARHEFLRHEKPEVVLLKFIQLWKDSVGRKTQSSLQSEAFQSVGVKRLISTGEEKGREIFNVLELQLDNNTAQPDQTLYEAMDAMIWEGLTTNEDSVLYLESVGDVFCVLVTRPEGGKSERELAIPATWYPDRYLSEAQGLSRDMRAKKTELKRSIEKMEQLEEKLTYFRPFSGNAAVDPRRLLQTSIQHLMQSPHMNGMDNANREDESEDVENQEGSNRNSNIIEQLKAIYGSVVAKLECKHHVLGVTLILTICTALEEQKEKARHSLREVSAMLTAPSENPQFNPKHRYKLRGVSTDPNITYILGRVEEASDNALDSEPYGEDGIAVDDSTMEEQWWRISYSSADTKPMQKTVSLSYVFLDRYINLNALLTRSSRKPKFLKQLATKAWQLC